MISWPYHLSWAALLDTRGFGGHFRGKRNVCWYSSPDFVCPSSPGSLVLLTEGMGMALFLLESSALFCLCQQTGRLNFFPEVLAKWPVVLIVRAHWTLATLVSLKAHGLSVERLCPTYLCVPGGGWPSWWRHSDPASFLYVALLSPAHNSQEALAPVPWVILRWALVGSWALLWFNVLPLLSQPHSAVLVSVQQPLAQRLLHVPWDSSRRYQSQMLFERERRQLSDDGPEDQVSRPLWDRGRAPGQQTSQSCQILLGAAGPNSATARDGRCCCCCHWWKDQSIKAKWRNGNKFQNPKPSLKVTALQIRSHKPSRECSGEITRHWLMAQRGSHPSSERIHQPAQGSPCPPVSLCPLLWPAPSCFFLSKHRHRGTGCSLCPLAHPVTGLISSAYSADGVLFLHTAKLPGSLRVTPEPVQCVFVHVCACEKVCKCVCVGVFAIKGKLTVIAKI